MVKKTPILPPIWYGQKNTFRLYFNFSKFDTICLKLSYFASIGHILFDFILFCLIKNFFPLICVIYGMFFSWSMTFLVGQSLTKSIKVGQQGRYPPPKRLSQDTSLVTSHL